MRMNLNVESLCLLERLILKNLAVLLLGLIVPASCSAESQGSGLHIHNFKFGLACGETVDADLIVRPTHICHESENILITGQGQCLASGEWVPCTWYGFEFEYESSEPDPIVKCVARYNESTSFVDPDKVVDDDVSTTEYSIELPGTQGRFFNPQYSIFAYRSAAEPPIISTTICSHDGRVMFEFSGSRHYPTRRLHSD
ncbi:MAG: hypothetical protein AAFN91_16580 [Pseudomonadota bacterium]